MLIALLQAVASGLAVGGAYALIALGFSITFTTTKTLNFSHGDFVSVGSFVGVTVLWLLLGKAYQCTPRGRDAVGLAAIACRCRNRGRDWVDRRDALLPGGEAILGKTGHVLGDEHDRLRHHSYEYRTRHLGTVPDCRSFPCGGRRHPYRRCRYQAARDTDVRGGYRGDGARSTG